MGAAITPTSAIETFNQGHTAFVQRLEAAPDQALSYLKPGDDYSLGGIVHHVNAVLEHYLGVLHAIRDSGYGPTEPRDRPGLMEEANQRAKHGLDRLQLTPRWQVPLTFMARFLLIWPPFPRPTSAGARRWSMPPARSRARPALPT